MHNTHISFIGRAASYSPNSVEKDRAILVAVWERLSAQGYSCAGIIGEEEDWQSEAADAYVSMGRRPAVVDALLAQSRPVVNEPCGVRQCRNRQELMAALERQGVPVPPKTGQDGYWVKRGDDYATTPLDVQFAADDAAVRRLCDDMRQRGVCFVDVRAHVVGDLVKFYGVRGTSFFRCYYPGDDGNWKFGDEQHNGRPHHYPFAISSLHSMMDRAAALTSLDIYGGDCIVRPDGSFVLIDLNDWPSFSRCREEAAEAIADRIRQRISKSGKL